MKKLTNIEDRGYRVVHPLNDAPEQKCSPEGLGLMDFSRSVKVSLLTLRGYLILMAMLVGYHLLTLAEEAAHHIH
jgi:hypothetical protein